MALVELSRKGDIALICLAVAATAFSYWALAIAKNPLLYFAVGVAVWFFVWHRLSGGEIKVSDLGGIVLMGLLFGISVVCLAMMTRTAEKALSFRLMKGKQQKKGKRNRGRQIKNDQENCKTHKN